MSVYLSDIVFKHIFQVGWFTADNAANNGVALREFAKKLNTKRENDEFDAKERYIRSVILQLHIYFSTDRLWNR